jgi:hypothetical protein
MFPGAQGSGIPQGIAALHMHEPARIDAVKVLTAVIIGWVAVLVCGVCGGLAGGTFSALHVAFVIGGPGVLGLMGERRYFLRYRICEGA